MFITESLGILSLLVLLLFIFPARNISSFILPAGFIIAILILLSDLNAENLNLDISNLYKIILPISLIYLLIKACSAYIEKLISSPLFSYVHKPKKILLVFLQAYIFFLLINSEYFWSFIYSFSSNSSLYESIKTAGFSLIILISPVLLCTLVISISLIILNQIPKSEKFNTLSSLLYSFTLIFAFYASLPILQTITEGILKNN